MSASKSNKFVSAITWEKLSDTERNIALALLRALDELTHIPIVVQAGMTLEESLREMLGGVKEGIRQHEQNKAK